MRARTIVLQLEVTVPATTGENEVARTISQALGRSRLYCSRVSTGHSEWGNWIVGAVTVVDVRVCQ